MKKKHLVLAVDFDGTCVEHEFPDVGPDIPDAADVLRKIAERGHKIVLNTCREDPVGVARSWKRPFLSEAILWFQQRGIPLRSVNETHPDDEFRDEAGPIGRGRKVYADIYIDDKNLGGFPGWKRVLAEIDAIEAGS